LSQAYYDIYYSIGITWQHDEQFNRCETIGVVCRENSWKN